MKKIHINVSSPYDVIIERGSINNCGQLISQVLSTKKAAIITDDIVDPLYSNTVLTSLQNSGFETYKFVFPNGESSKCSSTLNKIYDFLCENQITRRDVIIALGGGVVGDISGFAAATFLRGVDFIQIPTTLLAQIDSSVGGKTAIDIPGGKNLVGAFKQPALVLCDSETLNTLSAEILSDGMAEAIKYGMIRDKQLFNQIATHNITNVAEIIDYIVSTCIDIKRSVVEHDEFDNGERMILNFGHTIGHAVEGYYNYKKYTHGSAVAAGMCYITEKASDTSVYSELCKCVMAYNLPVTVPANISQLLPYCTKDKKRENNNINYVFCPEIGKSIIHKTTVSEFFNMMEGD